MSENKPKVLLITSEWPSEEKPNSVPFLIQHARFLKEEGLQLSVFYFRGRKNPFNYLRAWFDVRCSEAWKKADILHAHWGQSGLLTLFSRKKRIVTFHGSDLHGILNSKGKQTFQGRLLIAISRFLANRVDRVVVVSSELKMHLLNYKRSVDVIPMGVDPKLFKPMDKMECRMQLGINLSSKIVLFLSDPDRIEKRFWLAEKIVESLKERNPNWDITLLPVFQVAHELVPVYINASDVLLLTSRYEGAPTVIKETIACQVPIVSVDVGDVRSRISMIDGCSVCSDQNIQCLIDGLEKAIHLNGKTNPPSLLLSELDERNNVRRLIDVYNELLSE